MATKNDTFARKEKKYLITKGQCEAIKQGLANHMRLDDYGATRIDSLYLDTPGHDLICRSLEKPLYKEKLRIRSYQRATEDSAVFVELKKKYDGVVYKRRLSLPHREAMDALESGRPLPVDSQIGREIEYFNRFYGTLRPALYLCYDRSAYFSRESADLRVTFDRNISWRQESVTLSSPAGGRQILPPGASLMEIKAAAAIPMWLVELLSRLEIRQTSFSKYGEAYKTILSARRRNDIGGIANV